MEEIMRDSYERFFAEGHMSKDDFFNFGIRETIYAPLDKAKICWEELKQRIKTNKPVYIRGFGRNSKGSPMFQDFYKNILDHDNVLIDSTNNFEPTKVIRDMTGYSKTESARHKPIQNYQVSHIFGRTKNIYAFTAPWNIVYLPKIIDPFTGHEAKGELVREYQAIFRRKSYCHFKPLIKDYNKLISDKAFKQRIDEHLKSIAYDDRYEQADIDKLEKSVREELTPISI